MSKKERLSTEHYRGVRDFYPEDQAFLHYFLKTVRMVVERVGYVEYEASILEPAELYKTKGAENEEMVQSQTYTFVDRGGREVTLRPEMTPTVARMVAAKRRELGFPLRWYSLPNCFRYERPQRGRLREFWQPNIDIFGSYSPSADAEIIGVAYGIMRAFGAQESDFVIKVGSRVELNRIAESLSLDGRGKNNFIALLDRKSKIDQQDFAAQLAGFGATESTLSAGPPVEISKMLQDFKNAGINNIVWDPSIVRGFAYYSGMVFEVFDTHPDNNRALMGGGRYDNLTQLFDDEPLPGVGFAMGDETIRLFLESRGLLPAYLPPTQVYLATLSPDLTPTVQTLGAELRQAGVNVAIDFGERKLADQIKTASKHKIPYLIVVGEDEITSGNFTVRNLESGAEKKVSRGDLPDFFKTV